MGEDDDNTPLFKPDVLGDHESSVRRLMADAGGPLYVPLKSLAEAQEAANGTVVLEGDDGGQVYLVAKAEYVRCSEDALRDLLHDLDASEWNDSSMARVYYERHAVGEGIAGGMGGGVSPDELWLHPRLADFEASVRAVLEGRRQRMMEAAG